MTNKPPQAGEVAAMVERADSIYERCNFWNFWPERDPDAIIALIELRNLCHDTLQPMLTLLSAALQEKDGEIEALTEFAEATDAITITDYFSGRVSAFIDGDDLDDEDEDRWDRMAAARKRLIDLGIIEARSTPEGVWVADEDDAIESGQ